MGGKCMQIFENTILDAINLDDHKHDKLLLDIPFLKEVKVHSGIL